MLPQKGRIERDTYLSHNKDIYIYISAFAGFSDFFEIASISWCYRPYMVVVYLKMVFRKRKPITLVARDSYEQRVKWKLIVTLMKSFLFVSFFNNIHSTLSACLLFHRTNLRNLHRNLYSRYAISIHLRESLAHSGFQSPIYYLDMPTEWPVK